MSRTVVVIPCFNEAQRIDPAAFHRFTCECTDVHFLFVDDGSTDGTDEVLESLCIANDQCACLSLPTNCGKAAAVWQGMQRAIATHADFVGYWDADLATPLEAIPQFVGKLEDDQRRQLVCGARVQLLGRRIERRSSRHYLGRLFATTASWVLGMPIYDTQCGAKLFRNNEETAAIFAVPFRTTWIFDVELLARMQVYRSESSLPAASTAIYEIPLRKWRDIAGSKVGPRDFLRAGQQLAYLFFAYPRKRRSVNALAPLENQAVTQEAKTKVVGSQKPPTSPQPLERVN